MEKEAQTAIHTAEAEKYHFEFELKGLEEELEARTRIRKGEEERMVVRRECYDKEIATLTKNIDQSQHLISHAKEQMTEELKVRDHDFKRVMEDTRDNYEKRLITMKEDNDRSIHNQKLQIGEIEKELEGNLNFH